MHIVAVDDEPRALDSLLRVLGQVVPEVVPVAFTDSEEAFAYLEQNKVDVALLDIQMSGLTGLGLAKKCKSLCPTVNIIFVTGYSEYSMDALKLHVSGYLMKPVRADDLRMELENLRHPLPAVKRVRIQTFGNFEVYVDGVVLKVPRKKCKECLAYLVDRKGARVTYPQLSTVLWEEKPIDRSVQKRTQKVVSDLGKALEAVGAQGILIRSRVDAAINAELVDCDYFRALGGDMAWLTTFTGEYMSNYSWAESTLGELVGIRQEKMKA